MVKLAAAGAPVAWCIPLALTLGAPQQLSAQPNAPTAPVAAGQAVAAPTVSQHNDSYFQQAQRDLQAILARKPNEGRARNVILFVGDGMSIPTVTATRILDGQRRGVDGESNWLAFEQRLPHVALSRTFSHDGQVADSAPTATALVAGVKAPNGTVGLTQAARRGDCASQQGAGVTTLFDMAKQAGRATGLVTTTRITHATPAAAYAKAADRNWENDTTLPDAARQAGCKDIALQLMQWRNGDGFEVMLGGGRANFMPKEARDPEHANRNGARADGRNLIDAWLQQSGDRAYVWNQAQFAALPRDTRRLLGLFQPSHMQFEADRAEDQAGEPSLAAMTAKAIEVLSHNPQGYVLMVEAGRIDHAHHNGNAYRALTDTIALNEAVRSALAQADLNDTLVVVTADHSHVFTMAGYPPRGAAILGFAGKDAHGQPYTTLGYQNGPGAKAAKAATAAGPSAPPLSEAEAQAPDYRQRAATELFGETHGGDEVAVYAGGPWAHLFQGVIDQHVIFHIMRRAAGLDAVVARPK